MTESLQLYDGIIKEEDVRDMWDTGNNYKLHLSSQNVLKCPTQIDF